MAERDIAALIERDQIRMLLAVSRWRSFSGAAAELGITQSAISQQVKRLEALAGFPLFQRNRRGVELTSECEVVIYYARAMERLADDLRRQFDHAKVSETVSVGMSEDFCRTALPPLLGLLVRDFPTLDMRIMSGSYDLLEEAIKAQTVDIVVMRRWDRFPECKLLWTENATWHGHPRFATVIEDPVPLVLPLATNPTRTTIMNTLSDQGRPWKIRFEAVGIAGIEAALQCGLGVIGAPSSMPFHGVSAVGRECGLPVLPDIDFVMYGPSPSAKGVVHAVADILVRMAERGFRAPHLGDDAHSLDA